MKIVRENEREENSPISLHTVVMDKHRKLPNDKARKAINFELIS